MSSFGWSMPLSFEPSIFENAILKEIKTVFPTEKQTNSDHPFLH